MRKLESVTRSYPRALLASRAELLAPVEMLKRRAGVAPGDAAGLVEAFPLVFGLSAGQIERVLDFWTNDLGLRDEDVPKICRAFPSLLGVEVERQANVRAFLREIGVNNVARFATRLPPVLAYDVDADLRPKMAHLAARALSVYDVVRFPAYFSYPLEGVIAPRTAFLEELGLPLTRFELKTLFTPSDEQFAERVLRVDAAEYASFKKAFASESSALNPRGPLRKFAPRGKKSGGGAFPSISPGAPPASDGDGPPKKGRRRRGPRPAA